MTTRMGAGRSAGWKPERLARVTLLPLHVRGARGGHTGRPPQPWHPAGVWRVMDRSPDVRGPNSWWIAPVDHAARMWAVRHSADMIQGHTSAPGRLLVPAYLQLELGA
jgi:hypothetical protein